MIRTQWLMAVLGIGMVGVTAMAQTAAVPPAAESATTPAADIVGADARQLATNAIALGLNWLAAHQKSNGAWSNESHPALTALPMWAFARSEHPRRKDVLAAASRRLLTYVQDDGGIYKKNMVTGGLSTYNTAISMTALHALRDPSMTAVVLKARKFVASSQYLGSGDAYDGGFGYSRSTFFVHGDLQNTAAAIQGMRLTADVEDLRPVGEKRADMDWKAVVKFMERLQNGPQTGEANVGGMSYKPGSAKAGTTAAPDGTVALRSTGSMTYSGLLSLIYADLARDDRRVQSAFQWTTRHWTLDENPGVGDGGLFFFYSVLSRALNAYGLDEIPIAAGRVVAWRGDFIRKVASLQKTDAAAGQGYWVNDKSNSFWEGDPVLVTAYCVLSLETALGK